MGGKTSHNTFSQSSSWNELSGNVSTRTLCTHEPLNCFSSIQIFRRKQKACSSMCNFLLLKRHEYVSEAAPRVNSAPRSPAANLRGGVGAAGCIRDQLPADLSPLPWVSKQPRGGGGKGGAYWWGWSFQGHQCLSLPTSTTRGRPDYPMVGRWWWNGNKVTGNNHQGFKFILNCRAVFRDPVVSFPHKRQCGTQQ